MQSRFIIRDGRITQWPDFQWWVGTVLERVAGLTSAFLECPIDHLCYRVESTERYLELKFALHRECALLTESRVGGRLIACFVLPQVGDPRHTVGAPFPVIRVLELPMPKAGSPYAEGLEHLEFVTDLRKSTPALLASSSFAAASDIARQRLAVGPYTIKWHDQPLDQTIAEEQETMLKQDKHRIAIFVSGTGSNARVMIDRFRDHPGIEVALLVSNRRSAPALLMAAERGVPTLVVDRERFYHKPDFMQGELRRFGINFVVLAGFLWLIPAYLVQAFAGRIVNIHPALLPSYGGAGMYGKHVHEAVARAGDTHSGMTVHYVNEEYDEGDIIFQARVALDEADDAEAIAKKVLALEHRHYGEVVEKLLS